MADDRGSLDALMKELQRMRDELALKVNLGQAEAKDEWAKLEKKLNELRAQAKPLTDVAGETAEGVGSALELAAGELKSGYDKLRKLL